MVIFYSHVSLPEGIYWFNIIFLGFQIGRTIWRIKWICAKRNWRLGLENGGLSQREDCVGLNLGKYFNNVYCSCVFFLQVLVVHLLAQSCVVIVVVSRPWSRNRSKKAGSRRS